MPCNKCGECCKRLILSGSEYDREIVQMKQGYLGEIKYKGEVYHILYKPCIYLKNDNTCDIQDTKPEACRKFPGEAYSEFWKLIIPRCGELK